MNTLKRMLLAGTAFVGLSFGNPVFGTLLFSIDVDGLPVARYVDNCVASVTCPGGDQNPAIGTLSISATLGGVALTGSNQIANLAGGFLSSSSLQIGPPAAPHFVEAAVGATGFIGPANIAAASASGTIQNGNGSDYAYAFYNDALNGQGAENPFDTPGVQFDTFAFAVATALPSAYSHASGPIAVNDPGLYSMTQTVSAHLVAGETWVGNSQISQKTFEVSEPGALGMLGSSLLLLWFGNRVWGRRERTASIG